VMLVVNAKKAAQSAAALLYGFEHFDPKLDLSGVIFNNIASPNHWNCITDAAEGRCRVRRLGYLRKNPELILPERQLGLVSAHEHGLPEEFIDHLVAAIEANIDLDALLEQARTLHLPPPAEPHAPTATVRLGIAKDAAFCFYYQDNLDLLEQAGIELVPFSPLNDTALPEVNGLYFGGGFPEEFTEQLAQNQPMLKAVRSFNGKIIAECGGLIYLTKSLAGLIEGVIEMTDKLQACGYREVTFNRDTILGPKGTVLRGHEFHWSKWTQQPAEGYGAFQTGERAWGYATDRILASYFHIHFGSNPESIHVFKDRMMKG
jgi:cobyrinic acid a,c-diamide synthase